MTKDEIRVRLQGIVALDEDALYTELDAHTPGDWDASTMSTEELIEYAVANWQDDGSLRPATAEEYRAALAVHGSTEISFDDDAKVAEGSEGMWVQAWVWITAEDVICAGRKA